jgi:hypothetical protein
VKFQHTTKVLVKSQEEVFQSIEKWDFQSRKVNINRWMRGDTWQWIRESRSYRSVGSKCGVGVNFTK